VSARRTVAVFAAVVVAGAGAVALGAEAVAEPPVMTNISRPVVPQAKLVKAVEQREAWKVRAIRAERTLRHEPSVQEALTIASIAYRIDRGDLSSTAWCESTHRPHAKNGQYLGIMQLGTGFRAASRYFRAGLDPHSPYANIMAAAEVIQVQGYRQWQCRPGGRLAW